MQRMEEPYSGRPLSLGRIDPRRETPSLIAVWVTRFVRCLCLFLLFGVLQELPLAVVLFVIKTGCAVAFLVIQKPFSTGKAITRNMFFHIARYSVLCFLSSVLWGLGLASCGALRTSLLWDHSEVAVLAVLSSAMSLGSHNKSKGAAVFVLGVISLFLFDNDQSPPFTEHPEGPHSNALVHSVYQFLSFLGVPDHKGGVVLLLMGGAIGVVQRVVGRRSAVEIGGSKRLQALSSVMVSLLLLPWALIQLSSQTSSNIEGPGGETATGVAAAVFSHLPALLLTSGVFVLDYYVESMALQRMDVHRVARAGSLASFLSALALASAAHFLSHAPPTSHALTAGVVIASVLLLGATVALTTPFSGGHGKLVGYSTSGLPLYASQYVTPSLLRWAQISLRRILEKTDSRRIFYFLILNLAFTFVELAYGVWTNSLGLISDGFHMLFDCTALLVGLHASLMTRWAPTRLFSYGYGRVEVLSGFVNGLFLVVIAVFVLTEAVDRLLDPPHINTDRLLFVSVAGFIVNLIGIATFSHTHTHSHGHGHAHSHGHSHDQSHGHSHHNTNMRGVYLHVLADTLGSVGVIISSILVEQMGWFVADSICSLFIASLILLSVLPLLRESAAILLLSTPPHLALQDTLKKLPLLDGVLDYSHPHFWQLGSETISGTICVQVAPSANEQRVIAMVTGLLKEKGVVDLTVQVEKPHYLPQATAPQVYVDFGPHTGEVKTDT